MKYSTGMKFIKFFSFILHEGMSGTELHIAACFLNLGTREKRVVSFTLRPHCDFKKEYQLPLNRELGFSSQLEWTD